MKLQGMNATQVDDVVDKFVALMHSGMTTICKGAANHITAFALTADGTSDGDITIAVDSLGAMSTQWEQYTDNALMPALTVIATHAGKVVAAPLGVDVVDPKVMSYLEQMRGWIADFAGELWEAAKAALIAGAQDGETIAQLAARVRQVADVKEKKAKVIAQTAVISSINGGEWHQMMELAKSADLNGVKEWVATHDNHTRATHAAADGQRVPIDSHFVVGDEFLMFPGDPGGGITETINCRCTTVYDLDVEDQITASQTSLETLSSSPVVVTNGPIFKATNAMKIVPLDSVTAAFNPAEHPRGKDGRFIKRGVGLPTDVFESLKYLKSGAKPSDWTFDDKEVFVTDFMNVTHEQWANLKEEDKEHLQNLVDASVASSVPGSAKAQSHIDDLDDDNVFNDLEYDDETNFFDPDTPLPPIDTSLVDAMKAMNSAYKKGDIDDAELMEFTTMLDTESPSDVVKKLNEFISGNDKEDASALPGGMPLTGMYKTIDDAHQSGKITAQQASDLMEDVALGADDDDILEDLNNSIKSNESSLTPSAAAAHGVEQQIYVAHDNGEITEAQQESLLNILDKHGSDTAATALKGYQDLNAAPPAPAPLTTGSSEPIKITHTLIHAKHTPGTVIAMSKDGDVRVKWNGNSYDIEAKLDDGSWTGPSSMTNVKKSKLYALLGDKFKDAEWVTPGKKKTVVTHATPLDAAPTPAPVPHPVSAWPTTPGLINDNSDPFADTPSSPSPFTILEDTGENGDGYAAPGLWGKFGAAGVLIKNTDENGVERFLMVQRGPMVSSNKGKWQLAGGAINSKETPEQGAAREIFEEIGAPQEYLTTMKKVGTHQVGVPIPGKEDWVYHNIAAEAPTMFKPKIDGTETGDAKWLTKEEIQQLVDDGKMHPAVKKALPSVFALYDTSDNKETPAVEQLNDAPSVHPDLVDSFDKHATSGAKLYVDTTNGKAVYQTSDDAWLREWTSPTGVKMFQQVSPGTLNTKLKQGKLSLVKEKEAATVQTLSTPNVAQSIDVSAWKKIGGQGGSNKGGLYEAPDGQKYYVKSLDSPDHVNSEVLAAALYKAAGIDVPEVRHGHNHPDGWDNVIVSPIVPNAMQKHNKYEGAANAKFKADTQAGFLVDVWLANHDVIGQTEDNIVTADGKPWRIDMGGSLAYRAQGGTKTDWGNDPMKSYKGMKSKTQNYKSFKVFGDMNDAQEKESAKKLLGISDDKIDQLVKDAGMPQSMADTLKARKKAILDKYGLNDGPTDAAVPHPLTDPETTKSSLLDKYVAAHNNGHLTDDEFALMTDTIKKTKATYLDVAQWETALEDKIASSNSSVIHIVTMTEVAPSDVFGDISDLEPDQITKLDNLWKAWNKGLITKDELDAEVELVKNPSPSFDSMAPVAVSAYDVTNIAASEGYLPGTVIAHFEDPDVGIVKVSTLDDTSSVDVMYPNGLHMKMTFNEFENAYANMSLLKGDAPSASASTSHGVTLPLPVHEVVSGQSPMDEVLIPSVNDDLTYAHWSALTNDQKKALYNSVSNAYLNDIDGTNDAIIKLNEFKLNDAGYGSSTPSSASTVTSPAVTALDLNGNQKYTFYKHFKAEKVSPAWSAAKIYKSMHAAKQKMSGDPKIAAMSDAELLKVLDGQEAALHGKMNAYSQKVHEWLQTPNGVKAFKELNPNIATAPTTYSPAAKKVAKKVSPNLGAAYAAKKAASSTPALSPDTLLNSHPGGTSTSTKTTAELYTAVKAGSSGTSVKDKPAPLFANLHSVAKANGATVAEVINAMDVETKAKYGAVSTTYSAKITDWLNTPSGKKTANEINAGTWTPPAKSSGGGYGSSWMSADTNASYKYAANLPLGEKVTDVSQGVPAWNPNDTTNYPVISIGDAASLWTQMQNTHGLMTDTQKKSLKYYTSNAGFSNMNNYLRGYTGASQATQTHVTNAQAGMRPSTKAVVLHRGNGWFKGWESYDAIKKHEGTEFKQEAFFSASVGGHAAFGFKPIRMTIECPEGTPMAYVKAFSNYGGENEMLLAAHLSYKIISVTQKDGRVDVHMRVIAKDSGAS